MILGLLWCLDAGGGSILLASASLASHGGVCVDPLASTMRPKRLLARRARCRMGHISCQLPSLNDEAFEAQELDVLDETDGDDSCLSNTISLSSGALLMRPWNVMCRTVRLESS